MEGRACEECGGGDGNDDGGRRNNASQAGPPAPPPTETGSDLGAREREGRGGRGGTRIHDPSN